jgi:hypothetical protein
MGSGREMSPLQKAAALIATAFIALLGFLVLDLTRAVLWLLFFAISYPVLIAMLGSVLDGTRFTAAELISIYKESIRAIPALLQFLKDLILRNK